MKEKSDSNERAPGFRGQWKLLRFRSRQQYRDIRHAAKIAHMDVQAFMLSAAEIHAAKVIGAEKEVPRG